MALTATSATVSPILASSSFSRPVPASTAGVSISRNWNWADGALAHSCHKIGPVSSFANRRTGDRTEENDFNGLLWDRSGSMNEVSDGEKIVITPTLTIKTSTPEYAIPPEATKDKKKRKVEVKRASDTNCIDKH
ncbi:hypothetical protein ColTof4_00420 [Colletotrichum tofieldiae]|nr:hypothetical protein ColTof3_07626 [Colletotrichum tofieldiae]GKT67997.1 hypothetical protein ColTof4_00420 [Colletotrichum tofieldiae]GKT91023.1 hypothetical protein Ct61P_08873 [Colletotrichum tofieldiae]